MTMRRLLRALITTMIAIGLAGATAIASRAATPTPADLGTLGGTRSVASGINDAGQIAVYSYTAGDAEQHAVLWDVAAPVDMDTVGFTVTGGISYTNSAALTGGNLAVARDNRGITSVTGTGTFASSVSGSAEATFNVRRFWILSAYTGTVRIADPAAGIALNHTLFFSRVNPDGAVGATNTQGWFDLSSWPWRTYTLSWTVQDIA